MIVLINGVIGVASSILVGKYILGFELFLIMKILLVSVIAGVIALTLTLRLERREKVKTTLLRGSLRTHLFFFGTYFLILLGIIPEMREVGRVAWMITSLTLTNVFSIPVFGKIQDWLNDREFKRKSQ